MAGPVAILIEDEEDILDVNRYNLEREGFTVYGYTDGQRGLAAVQSKGPDIVLLDLMLPGLDGIEICRRLRADPRTSGIAIIMVTAKGEEADKILGLHLGADDYLAKPYSPRELMARVKAVLRRNRAGGLGGGSRPERLEFDGLVIDSGRHEVLVDGRVSDLTATEFRLLHFLACHPGRVFTRDQLVGNVIGDGAIVVERNIDVHVRSIRKKLGEEKAGIETVRGVGYRFRDGSG
jgi:two-component system, OmpR family, alkaline phosphatase synthesis response regulator PhoP